LSFLSAQVYPVPLLFTPFYHPLFLISVVLLSFSFEKKSNFEVTGSRTELSSTGLGHRRALG